MEIIKELKEIPNLSLALGFFDGVHIGHQAVISSAVKYAKNNGYKSAVICFEKHPSIYLGNKNFKYIITKETKYDLFDKMGVDYVIELDFPSVCNMHPAQYLENLIMKYFSPIAISSGENHTFGINKSGDPKFLSDNQEKYGYKYFIIPPQAILADTVSSTMIRHSIKDGAFNLVNKMLGRNYCVSGTIQTGQKLGRTINFPTINIFYPEGLVNPHYGVYSVNVILPDGKIKKGIANFGVKPTISNSNQPILEVHILDFEGDLYSQKVCVEILKLIRYERKFNNLEDLRNQILLDIKSL